ncbi:MAG: TonB-dependent receptor [Phenylobacterium sp.]|uniref:TonB-dependent receptor n=1 Tax=Phenylobacterium sp. TaxID=1871053 RepID=UPI00261F1714|nr:TonB-dependent receptor [Phenylobacterium sp.]MDB5497254.1 TonB-dependent receptor [Phenylobacterium sp.]
MDPKQRRAAARTLLLACGSALALGVPAARAADEAAAPPPAVSEVVVTASRQDLLGVATTASQGSVTQQELSLRPVYRVGQLLESTPGLVVTAHSGEGKANQYLVRGFNLDHGTDIANFVDDMPVNRPTNTHGQGYSDVNFEIPELAQGLDYTKGPYYAAIGDFGAVASTHLKLANEVPNQLAVAGGSFGIYNMFAGGTHHFGYDDRIVGGLYYGHVDGPFDHPDNFRKFAGELRYSHGDTADGYSATLMYYKGDGNFTTDQPLRAIQEGLIDRFGTLDPTDGSSSERISLSGRYGATGEGWKLSSSGYYIHSRMTLWNDFTHFLDDPVNGDQEAQNETRDTFGGQLSLALDHRFGAIDNQLVVGLQARRDRAYLDRRHTKARQVLDYCEVQQPDGPATPVAAVSGACAADRVRLLDLGAYVEDTTHWTPWLRTVVGLREEYYQASDHSLISGFSGSGHQSLAQPKGSIVLGPFFQTELYLSAGRGFHSDDVRGVFGTVPLEGVPGLAGKTPFLAPATGEEVGLRTNIIPRLSVQVAVFQEDFQSELAYNADAGQDEASAPSRRQGVEISAEYRPFRWMELNADLAFSKARYRADAATLANFGLSGPFIADAPSFIGSFGILVDNLGPWFGGLQWRYLGKYPISDGDEFPQDKGYSEINLDVGYKFSAHVKAQLTIFNLTNTKANAAAYFYAARLPGEPAEGVADFQVHPLEPISAAAKITYDF